MRFTERLQFFSLGTPNKAAAAAKARDIYLALVPLQAHACSLGSPFAISARVDSMRFNVAFVGLPRLLLL